MIKSWLKTYTQGRLILQGCAYLVILMVLVSFIVNHPADLAEWRFFGTVLALVALLVLNVAFAIPNPNLFRKAKAVQIWVFLIASAVLILSVLWMSAWYDVAYLLAILCMQACVRLGVWPGGVIFGVVNMAAWSGLLAFMQIPSYIIAIVQKSAFPGVFFGILLMTILMRYEQQTKRAEALLKELETAREKEMDLAVAEERVRLARDIHDGLGHHLTVLSIQLQAAGKLVERDPQAAAEAIQVCRAETQAALEEVRHSVGVMRQARGDRRPLPETLAALVGSFGQHTQIQASFACSGTPREISDFARETLYRAVQEGLTNAQKHANHARQVAVRLAFEADFLRLWVTDDGQGPTPETPANPAGFGLEGLRERVARLGGAFRCGPGKAGGFEIEICIPIQGSER